MSATDADVTLSKSARKRANKKARDAEGGADEEEAAPPAPAPAAKKAAAKPKAEPKAPEPAPKAKGKAKAKAAEPPAPEPAPKAEAKAKGKAQPKAAAEPKAAQPASKASAKAKAKAKKEQEEAEEEAKKAEIKTADFYAEIDDGSRADEWEVSSGVDKKRQKQMEKAAEKKLAEKMRKEAGVLEARGNQYIPGMAPVDVQVNQAKGKKGDTAKVSQSVSAVVVTAAAAAAGKEPEKVDTVNSHSATVKVPENRIGIVVGPKGSTIIMIKEKTGVKTIDMQGEVCTIVGSPDAVALAEHAVRQLVEKGYMALAYDDFEEEGVPCLPTLFPDLIGSKGAVIQLIKKEAKVEVTIPAVPKNAKPGQKFKVTLAGSKTAVALGKEIIRSISMYGHHEVTHPGQTHQEMEIEEWKWRYLIGSKGSEMRHIQNNYKVRVNIPREFSECQNVVVLGEPRDVDRAVKYIEKVMWEADQPKGRGAPEASADDGYTEAPEEDWMSAYMYKRK